jgi:hypothetical protein
MHIGMHTFGNFLADRTFSARISVRNFIAARQILDKSKSHRQRPATILLYKHYRMAHPSVLDHIDQPLLQVAVSYHILELHLRPLI